MSFLHGIAGALELFAAVYFIGFAFTAGVMLAMKIWPPVVSVNQITNVRYARREEKND